MAFTVKYDEERDCVCVSVKGAFNLVAMRSLSTEVGTHLEENQCNCILNDMRNASLIDTITNTWFMPGMALRSGIHRRIKRALVVSDISQEFLFLETVFLNSGNIVKLFLDIDDARNWLFIDRIEQ
ncbi:MAG: hypothetical protein KAH54_10845 [Candidatus Sabulitectum sp.]|nr:hypothetical protein [Candidatus Sabulitectum sp.]